MLLEYKKLMHLKQKNLSSAVKAMKAHNSYVSSSELI